MAIAAELEKISALLTEKDEQITELARENKILREELEVLKKDRATQGL